MEISGTSTLSPRSAPTVQDVARAAGVGIGTVSRVINNHKAVRPDTAQVVRRAIAALGYQAPPPSNRRGPRVGSSFRRKTSREKMALIVLGPRGLRWILDLAPVYASVLHGIESALAQRGQSMLVRQVADWEALEQIVRTDEPDGLILLGDDPHTPAPRRIQEMPVVWVMGSPQQVLGDFVQPNHSRLGMLAAEWALRHGHQHCALVGSSMGSPGYVQGYRNDAFCWTIEQAGGQVLKLLDEEILLVSSQQHQVNRPVMARLLDQLATQPSRPTALLSQADIFTPSIYRMLEERGIVPQRDVAIITINNERPYLTALEPAPVVIDLQAESIGRRAVDQLFWRIGHRHEPHVRVMVDPLLLEPGGDPA